MGDRLKGKNAVVTGAGRGIGRDVALALAAEGANVVVCDIGGAVTGDGADKGPADEVVEELKKLGVKAVTNYGDVSNWNDSETMINTCVENFGSIDILCNIAGIDRPKMIFNMEELDWDRVLNVHLKGTFNLSRHACALMRQQRYGRIINTSSDAFAGTVGHVNYGAAKSGIVGLTYAIAREMGRYGVTCNAFIPRAATRMILSDEVKAGLWKRVEKGIMTKEKYDALTKIPGADYFASLIVYLASDAAAHVNGQLFGGAGGRLSYWATPSESKVIVKDYEKEGPWTFEEIQKHMDSTLLIGYVNPAPAEPEKK
jgi:NAD(P)-dependent dehydrogenase (short-subunit alcohol dehydrogenase family)